MSKKIILLGRGDLAIRIANWFVKSENFELIKIVPVIPESTWMDSLLEWAKKNKISYVTSGDYNDIDNVHDPDWKIDLVFSCFYDKIIKQWFIDKCEKILNLHHAPLPRYRGILPINWSLKNKEKKHGVTIHEITTEYAWTLFQQTMPILYKIKPIPQDDSISSYYSKEDSNLLGDRFSYNRKIKKESND